MSVNEEITNIMNKDPAARSRLEVLLCYPGLHAVLAHRVNHWLWVNGHTLAARFLSQVVRSITGIEIHPGAQIGSRVFIDHGMGVVIGETTVVGDDCVIYQGVTLGAGAAARKGAQTRGTKRHPTLGKAVIVGSGAEIQGGITVGDNVQVASGSIVLKDVPDNCVVVGVPGRVLYRNGIRVPDEVPDPEADAIKALKDRLTALQEEVDKLGATGQKADGPAKGGTNGKPLAGGSDPIDVFLHGAGI